MAKQSRSETTKLSLVNNQNSAFLAHTSSMAKKASYTIEDIASYLPNILQTTLDIEQLIPLFNKEISKAVAYDNLDYKHQALHCQISLGVQTSHSCHYRLEINNMWLGEITFSRKHKFSDHDVEQIEQLLCQLIYPLRNCILFRQTQVAALHDSLTKLNNRAAFDSSIKREIELSHRQNTPLSLILIDLDRFKTINDNHGHSAGDAALKSVAEAITHTMRSCDMAFRYGGEEFTLVLSNTQRDDALLVAERLRKTIAELECEYKQSSFQLTVSLGIAQLAPYEKAPSLFDRADKALYQAKQSGRNQSHYASNSLSH